jgi:SAM-dependent methyltransferase
VLKSQVCKFSDFESEWFARWAPQLGHAAKGAEGASAAGRFYPRYHRKDWEFCAVVQALVERGVVGPGKRGLGFAVGNEPVASLLASLGSEIVASDAPTDLPGTATWNASSQHAASLDAVYKPALIERDAFDRLVQFVPLDMNAEFPFPPESFDFIWSCCALEHLGTLNHGAGFIIRSARLLRPGGIAVHTTEFNVSSNTETVASGQNVIFRRRDLEEIAQVLRREEKYIEALDFDPGDHPFDLRYDRPPFYSDPARQHIKLLLDGYISTSSLLIVRTAP